MAGVMHIAAGLVEFKSENVHVTLATSETLEPLGGTLGSLRSTLESLGGHFVTLLAHCGALCGHLKLTLENLLLTLVLILGV